MNGIFTSPVTAVGGAFQASTAGGILVTLTLKSWTLLERFASLTSSVNSKDFSSVGTPTIWREPGAIFKPVGNAPRTTLRLNGRVPDVT